MDSPFSTSSTSDSAVTKPELCPACKSSSIVTNAKIPDADSYWRCTNCGEVWNVARSQNTRYGGRPRR
jgi:predicted Zn finger-like uncharacterized protein